MRLFEAHRIRAMFDSSLNPIAGAQRIQLVGPPCQERDQMVSTLEAAGFRVDAVAQPADARGRLTRLTPCLVLLDLHPRFGSALQDFADYQNLPACQELLDAAKNLALPLVLLTSGQRFAFAKELLRRGASDYLSKPFSAEDLLRRIELTLESRLTLVARKPPGMASLPGGAVFSPEAIQRDRLNTGVVPEELLIGRSEAIQNVLDQVRLVAAKDTSVLITGETGTGKERAARAIHAFSRRDNRAMVSVNCGGIPPNLLEDEFFGHVKGAFTDAHQPRLGRFEQAHRGTIFLDEIGDLPLELQPKLLRVLQEREIHRIGGVETIRIDARVIAATNVDLWSRVGEGRFREDLFYRINVFPIELPPLRQRREDIPLFLDFFLDKFCRRDGLARKYADPQAEAELMARPWPGNIRELENAVEIAVIRSRDREWVTLEDFPEPRLLNRTWSSAWPANGEQPADFKQLVSRFERDLIGRVLERAHGNKSHAAEMLGLKRTTLVEKLKKLDAIEDDMEIESDAVDPREIARLMH